MKKVLSLALVGAMVPGLVLARPEKATVYLKGQDLDELGREKAIIQENRTFLPLRAIAEDLGFKVDWDQDSKKISVSKGDRSLEMKLGSKTYKAKGKDKAMDVVPFVKNQRTYLPVRFLGEALGTKVDWDSQNNLVFIGSYRDNKDGKDEKKRDLDQLGIRFNYGEKEEKNLVLNKDSGVYAFYDKKNYDANELGFIGGFYVEKKPQDIPVPYVLLGKVEGGYLCFCFASDVNYNSDNKDLTASYMESDKLVRKLLKTVDFLPNQGGPQALTKIEGRNIEKIYKILKDQDKEGYLKDAKIKRDQEGDLVHYSLAKPLKAGDDELAILASFSFKGDQLVKYAYKNYHEDLKGKKINRDQAMDLAYGFANQALETGLAKLDYDKDAYPSISQEGKVEAFVDRAIKVQIAIDLENGRVIRADFQGK